MRVAPMLRQYLCRIESGVRKTTSCDLMEEVETSSVLGNMAFLSSTHNWYMCALLRMLVGEGVGHSYRGHAGLDILTHLGELVYREMLLSSPTGRTCPDMVFHVEQPEDTIWGSWSFSVSTLMRSVFPMIIEATKMSMGMRIQSNFPTYRVLRCYDFNVTPVRFDSVVQARTGLTLGYPTVIDIAYVNDNNAGLGLENPNRYVTIPVAGGFLPPTVWPESLAAHGHKILRIHSVSMWGAFVELCTRGMAALALSENMQRNKRSLAITTHSTLVNARSTALTVTGLPSRDLEPAPSIDFLDGVFERWSAKCRSAPAQAVDPFDDVVKPELTKYARMVLDARFGELTHGVGSELKISRVADTVMRNNRIGG